MILVHKELPNKQTNKQTNRILSIQVIHGKNDWGKNYCYLWLAIKGCCSATSAVILVAGFKSRDLYNKSNAESGTLSHDSCTSGIKWGFIEAVDLSDLPWDTLLPIAVVILLGNFLFGGRVPDDECLWSLGVKSPLQGRFFFTGLSSKSPSGDCLWRLSGALSLTQSSLRLTGSTSGTQTSSLPETIKHETLLFYCYSNNLLGVLIIVNVKC